MIKGYIGRAGVNSQAAAQFAGHVSTEYVHVNPDAGSVYTVCYCGRHRFRPYSAEILAWVTA